VDYTKYNRISAKEEKSAGKINYGGFVLLAIVVFGLFYPVVTSGQSEGKLFIQQHVNAALSNESTALIIGAIICISRIVRVVSNVFFVKLYEKCKSKTGILLTALLAASICFLLFGSFIPSLILKIMVMSIGYIIILFLRDPYKLYIQDVVFDYTPKEHHQTLITIMEFGVKIGTAATSLIYALVLLNNPMWMVMAITLSIAIVEIILSIRLYKIIIKLKKERPI
jgi:hypothetical protein